MCCVDLSPRRSVTSKLFCSSPPPFILLRIQGHSCCVSDNNGQKQSYWWCGGRGFCLHEMMTIVVVSSFKGSRQEGLVDG